MNCLKLLLAISITSTLPSSLVFSQSNRAYEDGETLLYSGKYEQAISAYNHANQHPAYQYKITICKLMLGSINQLDDYTAFEPSMSQSDVYYYWLGKIHMKFESFADAKNAFNQFLVNSNDVATDKKIAHLRKDVNQIISYLVSANTNTHLKREEEPINGRYAEVAAMYTDDQLYFVSDRKDIEHYAVYSSAKGEYGWDKAVEFEIGRWNDISRVNFQHLDDGQLMIYNADENTATIFGNAGILKTIKMPDFLSEAHHFYLTPNHKKIIFSKPVQGKGLDLFETIYMSISDDWTSPTALNDHINSTVDEDYPFLSDDRKNLYFSSNRNGGIGKYDVYVSEMNEEAYEWSPAKNLGFPINSSDNDLNYVINPDGSACLVSNRTDSALDFDIYLINFE